MVASTIADRLNEALKKSGLSTRQFQIAMEKEGVLGASTGAVYRYLKGETAPAVDFLLAAAGVLRVRPPWLILGDGGPTEEDAAIKQKQEPAKARNVGNEMEDRLRELFPAYDKLAPYGRMALWETASRLMGDYRLQAGDWPEGEDRPSKGYPPYWRAMEVVADCLAQPLAHFNLEELASDQVADYVVNVCLGVLRLIPTPRNRVELMRKAEFTGVGFSTTVLE